MPAIALAYPDSELLIEERIVYPARDLWVFAPGSKVNKRRMLRFINERTGIDVEFSKIHQSQFIINILAIGGFCILVYVLRNDFKNPMFQLILTLLVYALCISGVVYNLVNRPSFLGRHGGRYQIINPSQRDQYGFESGLMGFTIMIGGVGLVLLYKVQRVPHNLLGRMAAVFCLFVVLFSMKQAGNALTYKLGKDTLGFFPPERYVRGPLINDQGITI